MGRHKRFLTRHDLLSVPSNAGFGVTGGGMTFTPGLDVIRQLDASERPVVAYSSVYPIALILIIAVVHTMHLALVALGAAG
jgi:putative transport protein